VRGAGRLLPGLLLAAVAACGRSDGALRSERALEALRAGRLDEAEKCAKAGALPGFDAFVAFVRGNVAFARSEELEPQASAPGAPPALFERMVADTEDALAHWRLAATSRDDWPAARRNVERALLRLEQLRERRRESQKRKRPDPPPPPPEPAPDTETPPPPPEARPELEEAALPEEAVRALLDLLAKKEQQKRELRSERRAAAGAEVERDW